MCAAGSNYNKIFGIAVLIIGVSGPATAFQQFAFQEAFFVPPSTSSFALGSIDGQYPTTRLPFEVLRTFGDLNSNTLPFGDQDIGYNMTCREDTFGNGDVICRGSYINPPIRVYRKTVSRGYVRAAGVTTELQVEPDSSFTEIEQGTGIMFHYDVTGRLDKIEDSGGRRITITRDASGRIARITDGSDRNITLTYSGNLIVQATFSAGGIISYQYTSTARGQRLARVTNLGGDVSSYTYDDSGSMISSIDPAMGTTTFLLSRPQPELIRVIVTDANGNLKSDKIVNAATNTTQITSALGLITVQKHDFRDIPLSETTSRGALKFSDYDADRNLIRTITNYDTFIFRYGAHGEPVQYARSLGETFTFQYDALGRLFKTTSPLDQSETFSFDAAGNVIAHKLPNDGLIKYTYDERGNRIRVEDPDGVQCISTYNAYGFITSSISPAGPLFVSYDSYGYSRTMGNGRDTSAFIRDAFGRPLATSFPGGAILTSAWSGNRLVSRANSTTGDTMNYVYSLGSLSRMTDAIGAMSEFAYLASGNLASYKSPLAQITNYNCDSSGNLAGVIWPPNPLGASARSFTYDSGNRTIRYIRETNDVIDYSYDGVGRLLNRIANGETVASFSYDSNGAILRAEDPLGATTFTRNQLGLVTRIGFANGVTLNYDFSTAGRLTRVSTTGYSSDIGYDSNGWGKHIGTRAGAISMSYDSAGMLSTLTYPNGITAVYIYGPSGKRERVEYRGVGGETIIFQTNRDSAGRIEHAFRSDLNETTSIRYSKRGEILEALIARPTDTLVYQYAYDSAGNRIAFVSNTGTTSYQYDPGNLLDTGGVNYGYNLAGELTSIGSRIITYTAEGMIRSDTTPQGTIYYDYDAFARRIRSSVGTDTIVWRLWDEADNEIADASAAGSITEFRYFIPGEVDGLLGFTRGTQTYFTLLDLAGNVAMVVDESGAIVARYAYEPFRLRQDDSYDSVDNKYRFASRREEPSGEIYVRARSLEAATLRFMQRDPLFMGNNSDPFSWHGYLYANNNPIQFSDPSGRACVFNVDFDVDVDQDASGTTLTFTITISASGTNDIGHPCDYLNIITWSISIPSGGPGSGGPGSGGPGSGGPGSGGPGSGGPGSGGPGSGGPGSGGPGSGGPGSGGPGSGGPGSGGPGSGGPGSEGLGSGGHRFRRPASSSGGPGSVGSAGWDGGVQG